MRFVLRNKSKIVSALSEEHYDRMIDSLREAFKDNKVPEMHKNEGFKYGIIGVDDIGHTCGLIMFYVVDIKYDVYKLAFKEFVN